MPKKKKKGQRPGPTPPMEGANFQDFADRPLKSRNDDGPLDIDDLRELLPPELANLDDEALQNLLSYFQSQLAEEADSKSESDPDENWTEELAEEGLAMTPAGFFEALDAIDELHEIDDPQECTRRLFEIIEQCPQCGDAWLTLAVFEPSNELAKEYLHRALKVSEWMVEAAQLNPKLEDAMLNSYVLTGLDICGELWKRGMRTDALEVHSELLSVSNDDSGGQRLIYAFRLLEQGWFDELEEQLPFLESGTQSEAGLSLLRALYFYAKDKGCLSAKKALAESHSMNPTIADFLLGDREWEAMDDNSEEPISPEDDEAQWVAYVAISATRSVEGFLRWMRDTLDYSPEPQLSPAKVNQQQLKRLKQIEQGTDDWILGSKTMDGESYYTAIYVSETEQVVGIVTDEVRPSPKRLWEIVSDAMTSPDFGQPLRPARLFVDRPSLAANWKKRCQSLDIECLSDTEHSIPEDLFEGLHETIQKVENQVTVCDETIEQARDLPRSQEVWHVGVFHPPIWITDAATPRKSCVALVIDEESELIRIHDLTDEKPSTDFLAQTVLKAMLYPLSPELEPNLPAEIKVHPASNPDAILQLATELDIEVSASEGNTLLTDAMESLIQHCSDASLRESLRESADMDDRELTRLYQNIARFYRASLWRSIPGDQILEVSSQDEDIGTFYAVIMGQMSQHRGIVICEERKPIEDIVTGRVSSPESEVTVLNYCEAHEIAPIDLWLIEQLNLDVAGEDAYPLLQRSISDQRFRRPTRSELLDIDIAVRCLPAFAEQPVNAKPVSHSVSTFQGPVVVSLKWTVPA